MRYKSAGLAFVFSPLFLCAASLAGPPYTAIRTIAAHATGAPSQSDSAIDGPSYDNYVVVQCVLPAAQLVAVGYQSSHAFNTPNFGFGAAGISVSASGEADYSVSADSLFAMLFEVPYSDLYDFNGNVTIENSSSFVSSFASIQLENVATGSVLADYRADQTNPGGEGFATFVPLAADTVYRFLAVAHAESDGAPADVHESQASWQFSLRPAEPEPASLALFFVAIVTILVAARSQLLN